MLRIQQGDITKFQVDVIVNAANSAMLGGGGVDGAIHRAAGPELRKACEAYAEDGGVRCPVGYVRVTPAFRLPAKFVIHTVGPIWRDGAHGEMAALALCYSNVLLTAQALGVQSIAFPAISTGAFGFPLKAACKIAVRMCGGVPSLEDIFLVAFDDAAYDALLEARAAQ